MNLRATIADEMNRHHRQATVKADEAVHHAIGAGKLLLEVTASLAHGQFLPWLAENLTVRNRQAQRYMSMEQGKRILIWAPAKSDIVSHLAGDSSQGRCSAGRAGQLLGIGGASARPQMNAHHDARLGRALAVAASYGATIPDELRQWPAQPVFDPTPWHWYSVATDSGAYWLVASLEHPDLLPPTEN